MTMSRAEEAARTMTAEALYQYGIDSRDGTNGRIKMPTTAIKYLTQAGVKGYVEAQYELACMYENGVGCIADIQDAIDWYAAAASWGHIAAKEALERLKGSHKWMF